MKRFYTSVLILITLSGVIHIAHAQNETDWMPDANLRTAVRNELGLANNEALTHAKMLELQILEATNAQIADLTGLEYAVNMKFLLLNRNNISDLTPLMDMAKLDELRLTRNSVSDVTPLAGLTTLTQLRLAQNNITDATPLGSLVNLERLKIRGNENITNLHVLAGLPRLNDIDITIPEPPAADPPVDPPPAPQPPADTDPPGVTLSAPSDVQNGAFSVTITFTEAVSDFLQPDLSLSGTASTTITAWETTDNITYTATITPTTSGDVTLNVPAGVATDTANNPNTASTPQTITVDVDPPSVNLTVPSWIQTSAFEATITFSEPVSDFVQADVGLSGTATVSITAWAANTDNTVYIATITPATSGDVTLNVPAEAVTDAAGNSNTVSQTHTVNVDIDHPGVNISVPSGVQNGAFDVTITFTERILGLKQTGLSLTGTAEAIITAWRTTDKTTFTATVTPTSDGEIILNVPEYVAVDNANHHNTASAPQTVSVLLQTDTDSPEVSITVPSEVHIDINPFDVTITFTETVLGFMQSDLSLTDSTATASITAWNTSDHITYTAKIIPTTDGVASLSIPAGVANDIANNPNTAATTQTVTVSLHWMPDANLRTVVREALSLADDEELTEMKMLELTALSAMGERISDLSGLEHASKLQTLNLSWNHISDLSPLTGLTNLTKLNLGINRISDITPLENLTNLTWLELDANNISDISVLADMTNLTRLYLKDNSISDISNLSGLANLRYLHLSGNPILDTSPLYSLLGNLADVDIEVSQYPPWDVNEDSSVDATDSALVTTALGQSGTGIVNPRTDVNGDGTVDNADLTLVTDNLDDANTLAPTGTDMFSLLDRTTLASDNVG